MKNLINYSDKDYELYNYFPQEVQNIANKIIALPDLNPGKAPLPTGSVVSFSLNENDIEDLYKYTESDVGCGMVLVKSGISKEDFNKDLSLWDTLGKNIKSNKGKLGDLGSGNHFLDAMVDKQGNVYFLCHTGSRDESKVISQLIKDKKFNEYNSLYSSTIDWADQNRLTIINEINKLYGKTELIVHNNHNHYEIINDDFIVRKGATNTKFGEMTVIPSHMTGKAIVVKSTDKISETLNSLSHGTGRVMSRSEAKNIDFDFQKNLRDKIYIPEYIKNQSLRTESPFVYRDIDDVIILLDDLITVELELFPIAYIGQL